MTQLIENVRQWGIDKGLTGPTGKATIQAQYRKFVEEAHELFLALKDQNRKETRDALGDMQVVAILACDILGLANFGLLEEELFTELPEDGLEYAHSEAISVLMDDPVTSFMLVRAIAKLLDHDPAECLQEAYDVISKRTGKMVDGQFVKDVPGQVSDDDFDEPLPKPQCQIGEECESCQ